MNREELIDIGILIELILIQMDLKELVQKQH